MTENWVQEQRKSIYNFLNNYFSSDKFSVDRANAYSVVSEKNHFWRPLLVLSSAKSFGVDESISMPIACAAEVGHSGTLIMDDLPSMDNADTRRGKEACHKKFNITVAELCSLDLCAGHSYSLIFNSKIEDKKKLIIAYNQPKTIIDIVRGQEQDLFYLREKKKPSQEEVINSYSLKTGALFSHCCYAGGVLGNAEFEELEMLKEIGNSIGIIYQVADDVKDKTGSRAEIGKPIGQDADSGKWTLIDIVGLQQTKTIMKKYFDKLKLNVKKLKSNGQNVRYLESVLSEIF